MSKQQELCVEVNKRASSFLESGEWTDCKFVVGDEPRQVIVGGYKLVMAMASPVFEAMFYGSLAETTDHITIADVEPEIFKAMLRYIYTGNINISSCSEAMQLYYTAKKYMLDHLMEKCSNYLQNNVNLADVCQLCEHSLLFDDEMLTQKCIKIFTENTKELLQDNSFKDAALSTVEKIFSLNELNIDSEVDLINAAALYASAQNKKIVKNTRSPKTYTAPHKKVHGLHYRHIDGVAINSPVAPVMTSWRTGSVNWRDSAKKNVEKGLNKAQNATERALTGSSERLNALDIVNKLQIRSVVKHIRLLTLTPQQYAGCTARSSLLTPSEDNAVLVNLVSNELSVSMFNGLSTSRIRRDKVGKALSKATFRYTVEKFQNLRMTERSPVFYVRNLPWQIIVRPNDTEKKYLSLGILCGTAANLTNWSCKTIVELRLICHKPGAENLTKKFHQEFMCAKEISWIPKFLPWDTVLDPTQGYTQDGAITVEVHLTAEQPQGHII